MAVKRYPTPPVNAAPPPVDPVGPASPYVPGEDPLAGLFGPESKTSLIAVGEDDSIPEEVASAIAEFGLTKHNFKVMLKEKPEGSENAGGHGGGGAFIKAWSRQIPSLEYIAQQWGPGEYNFLFTWMGKDPDTGRQATQRCEIPFTISEKYREVYEEACDRRTRERLEKQQRELDRLRTRGAISNAAAPGQSGEEKQSAKKYLEDLMATNQMLGLSKSGGGIDWEKLTPLLSLVLPPLLTSLFGASARSEERFDKMMQMMLAQTSANHNSMLELAKIQNPNPHGRDMMSEMFDMVKGAIDLKEAINGGRESTVDKVFGMIERVAPMIMMMASMPRAVRDGNPATKAAQAYVQSSPEFQEALHDPGQLAELIGRLDEFYGWRLTDEILSVGGAVRPAECVRDPEKELPAEKRVPAAQVVETPPAA